MRIQFVFGSEWQALYKDGEIVVQDSIIDAVQALEALGFVPEIESFDEDKVEAQLDMGNEFPDRLSDMDEWLEGRV